MFLLTTGALPDTIWFIMVMYLAVYVLVCGTVISLTVSWALGAYFLQGFGMREMLRTLGFKKSWYAFVPFCNIYALGYIADRYDDRKGRTKYAKRLLALMLTTIVLSVVLMISMLVIGVVSRMTGRLLLHEFPILDAVVGLADIALTVIAIVYIVLLFIALWRMFRLFAPEQAVVFLLISIFVAPSLPIVIYVIRNNKPQNVVMPDETVE